MADFDRKSVKPETLAAHAAGVGDDASGAVVPAIQPSTTFQRDPDYKPIWRATYGRGDSPSYDAAEVTLATLEGGEEAILFASGMAAAAAIVQALKPGDHLVLQRTMYWGVRDWIEEFARTWGLKLDLIDPGNLDDLRKKLQPGMTRLVWLESPANPTWDVVDLEAAAAMAMQAGALTVADSTVATPILTRPLDLGCDIVMHSATKYLNGHSDVVAGALVTRKRDDFWARIRHNRELGGASLGPFEAWLLQRGLRTLHLRVRQASANALAIAEHFEGHPAVSHVLYPGLTSHPRHAVARRQMHGGFGGMMSIRLNGGEAAALAAARHCKIFRRATSLGGVESLVEHRATIEGPKSRVPRDMLRLSIGVEHVDDLIADLEQAFAAGSAAGETIEARGAAE